MHRDHTQEDSSTPDAGSFFVGFLVGCITFVLCLILAYGLVASLNLHSPTGAGDSVEPWILLAILAIPIAEVLIFSKQGKRKSAIGVILSRIAILGLLFMLFACLAGWVCHAPGHW
jgi:hypothetical protein